MIYEKFKKNAITFPNQEIVFEDEKITYKELLERVESKKLPKLGKVALFLENSIEFIEWMLLASKYKFTLVPFAKGMEVDFKKFKISHIYDGKLTKINKEEPYGYIIVSTSGSTSSPKPIVLTEEIKLKRIEIAKNTFNLSNKDTILVSTPLHHSLAQRGVLLALTLGSKLVLMEKFRENRFLELIEKEKVSFTFAVSNQIEVIKDKVTKYDLSSIKALVSTSYSLNPQTKEKLSFLPIYECYGTSEIGCVTHLFIKDKHFKSVGKALNGVEIKIKNKEILVKSPWKFLEYFNMPDITKNSFEDSFFKTGDLGEIVDGYLYYKGRIKELIKTGGISVYPIDVEEVLKKVDGVKEVAVIGVEDSYFGEIVVAVIVGDVKKSELIKAANKHLAPYQRPLFYDIVEKLPKNEMGKIQKFKLKEKYKNLNLGERLKCIR